MDGKLVAGEVKKQVVEHVQQLEKHGTVPFLVTIQVGDDPASASYLKAKHKAADEVGIRSESHHLAADTSQDKLEALLGQLNTNPKVNGILVQLPLPPGFNEERVIERIIPYKDVDGLHPINAGKLASGYEELVPCTPKGVIKLLNYYKTPNLSGMTRTADILVSAVGKEIFQVRADHVKPKSAVIDVGLTRVNGKLRGDVEFDKVNRVAGHITPVPGGVGPMTVACLLENTVLASSIQIGLKV